jgi:hypothetical protein
MPLHLLTAENAFWNRIVSKIRRPMTVFFHHALKVPWKLMKDARKADLSLDCGRATDGSLKLDDLVEPAIRYIL